MVKSAQATAEKLEPTPTSGQKLSLTPKVSVQPEGFFRLKNEEVEDITTLGRYVLLTTKTAEGRRVKMFDQSGAPVQVNSFTIPGAEITIGEIAKNCAELSSNKMLSLSGGDRYGSTDISRVGQKLGLSSWDTAALTQELRNFIDAKKATDKSANISWDSIPADWLVKQQFSFKPAYEYRFDDSSKTLICQSGANIRTISMGDAKNGFTPPTNWRANDLGPVSNAGPQGLKNIPELRKCLKTDDMTPLNEKIGVSFEQGILKLKGIEQGQLLFSEPAKSYAQDPSTPEKLYLVGKDGHSICEFDYTKASGITTDVRRVDAPFGEVINSVKLDRSGNFAVLHVEDGTYGKILICDRETLDVLGEIPAARNNFSIDQDGNIIYADSNGRPRLAQTNMAEYVEGSLELLRSMRVKEMQNVVVAIDNFRLPDLRRPVQPVSPSKSGSVVVMVEESKRRLLAVNSPKILAADNLKSLSEISEKVELAKKEEPYANCPEVFEPLEALIRKRMESLRIKDFRDNVALFRDELSEIETPDELLRLDWNFSEIRKQRSSLLITDRKERSVVEAELKEVSAQLEAKHNLVRKELDNKLNLSFTEVKKLVSEVATLGELNALERDTSVLSFIALCSYVREPQEKQRWRDDYRALISDKQLSIEETTRKEQEIQMNRLAIALDECREVEEEIEAAIRPINAKEDLIVFRRTDALLLKFEAKLQALPEDLRGSQELRLERIFDRKQRDFTQKAQVTTESNGKVVRFEKETFPVYQVERVVWRPKVVPISGNNTHGKLVFESNIAGTFKPDAAPVPFDLTNEATKKEIEAHRSEAEAYFNQRERKVPKWNDKWVLNEFGRSKLDNLAAKFKIQIEEQPELLIVESDAGAGKDVDLEMFAHLTNREIVEIPCSAETDKEEITLDFSYDPKKGTGYIDSKLIDAIQRPGSIILFNEINTLQSGVAHMLNTLFDGKRKLILRDGREIKADPSVILVGLINPQNYIGVKPLPEVLKSRARIVQIGFPPEKSADGARYAPFEAEILSKYVPGLAELSQKDFYKLWDHIVNSDHTNGADKVLTPERKQKIHDLREIVKIANTLRKSYQDYRRGVSGEVVSYPVGIRDTIKIAIELKRAKDAKTAIKEVVLGKIGDYAERDVVERIIGS